MSNYTRQVQERFGDSYKAVKSNQELIFRCPNCGRIKLYVNMSNGLYHCFRCGYSGRLSGKRKSMLDVKDNLTRDMEKLKTFNYNNNKDEIKLIPFKQKPLTEEQKQALYNRGLTDYDIKFYNICGRDIDNRIQIPNYVKGCLADVICNWQYDKSKIDKRHPKYLNSEGTPKSKVLFNYDKIPQNAEQIILTEGIFNAITAGKNAVASYGCSLSDRQCRLLLDKEPKSILIAYDSDEPGVNGAIKVIEMLKSKNYKGKVEYILLPKNIDINDIGHENFINYYNNNKILIDLSSPISVNLPNLLYRSKTE